MPTPNHHSRDDTSFYFLEALGAVPPQTAINTVVNALVEAHLTVLKGLLKSAVGTQRPLRYAFNGDHRFEPIVQELAARLRQEGFNSRARYCGFPLDSYYAVDIH